MLELLRSDLGTGVQDSVPIAEDFLIAMVATGGTSDQDIILAMTRDPFSTLATVGGPIIPFLDRIAPQSPMAVEFLYREQTAGFNRVVIHAIAGRPHVKIYVPVVNSLNPGVNLLKRNSFTGNDDLSLFKEENDGGGFSFLPIPSIADEINRLPPLDVVILDLSPSMGDAILHIPTLLAGQAMGSDDHFANISNIYRNPVELLKIMRAVKPDSVKSHGNTPIRNFWSKTLPPEFKIIQWTDRDFQNRSLLSGCVCVEGLVRLSSVGDGRFDAEFSPTEASVCQWKPA